MSHSNTTNLWRDIAKRGLVLALVLGLALVVKPALVIPTLKSPRALAVIGALLLGYLAVTKLLLPRLLARAWMREALSLALLGTAALLLVLPYFRTVPYEEARPADAGRRHSAGALQGIDHRAAGEAVLYQAEAGARLLRLEALDLQGGPDYDLYLVPGAGQRDPAGGVRLGDLRGTAGNLNFPLPQELPFTGAATALIWCEFFYVPVANATITLPGS